MSFLPNALAVVLAYWLTRRQLRGKRTESWADRLERERRELEDATLAELREHPGPQHHFELVAAAARRAGHTNVRYATWLTIVEALAAEGKVRRVEQPREQGGGIWLCYELGART